MWFLRVEAILPPEFDDFLLARIDGSQAALKSWSCPLCKGPLVWKKDARELICKADRLAFPVKDDIPVSARGRGADAARRRRALALANGGSPRSRSSFPRACARRACPGKMLADIGGQCTLVAWVAERAKASGAQSRVHRHRPRRHRQGGDLATVWQAFEDIRGATRPAPTAWRKPRRCSGSLPMRSS